MSVATTSGKAPYYFVPAPSRHPVMAAIGLFFVILGAGQWVNGHEWGMYSLFGGLALWAFVLQQWFREAISESDSNTIRVVGRGHQLHNSASNEASSSEGRNVHAGIAYKGKIRPEHAHIVSVELKFEGHVRTPK